MLLPVSPSSSGAAAPAFPTASVDATADQATLAPVTLGLTSSAAPSAYVWRVNGSATGLSSDTAAAPTFTPPGPGQYTVTCTATIAGESVIAAPDTFRVGDGLPRVRPSAGTQSIAYS